MMILMSITLSSCGHFLYYETQVTSERSSWKASLSGKEDTETAADSCPYNTFNPSSKEKKYKKIYCTPEDEKKGKKEVIDYSHIACGLTTIQPTESKTLEIQRIFSGIERHRGFNLQIGHHLLILKSDDKILQQIKVEKETDIFWYEVAFVKIRKGVYWADLNNDGYVEFAVLPRDTGNSEYRAAYLYTLKDNSFHFYERGVYIWPIGEHVMLNCPKCSRFDFDACKKCL